VDVVYFQGWLWGMALMGLEHHGLEVCYSRDGGVTWEFPGIPVTMAYTTLANATYYKLNRIVKTDNALVFQSAIDAVGWTGTKQVEYVTIQVGA
jgi:hypothetical protein